MFIKLTKLDGSPVWLNASFVVTIEPRKGGGSVVVPVGDGFDYDVKEMPEAVLAMLAKAPAVAIVPIPAGDSLTKTPEDVSPSGGGVERFDKPAPKAPVPVAKAPVTPVAPAPKAPAPTPMAPAPEPASVPEAPTASAETAEPAKPKTVRKTRAKKTKTEDGSTEAKPKTTRKTRAKAAAAPEVSAPETPAAEAAPAPDAGASEAAPAEAVVADAATADPVAFAAEAAPEAETQPVAEAVPAEPSAPAEPEHFELLLDDSQILRLRKLTPRTVQRLKNTLVSQFQVTDCEYTIRSLVDNGIIVLGVQGRVIWR